MKYNKKVKCPQCRGKGYYDDFHTSHICCLCNITGKVSKKSSDKYYEEQIKLKRGK